MKLIIENWRKFVNEEKTTIKKLRIFDFDETIAYTQSSVRVVTATGGRLTLPSQEEFDRFIKSEVSRLSQKGHRFEFDPIPALMDLGYEFDFSDFSQVRDPRENEQVTKIISNLCCLSELKFCDFDLTRNEQSLKIVGESNLECFRAENVVSPRLLTELV